MGQWTFTINIWLLYNSSQTYVQGSEKRPSMTGASRYWDGYQMPEAKTNLPFLALSPLLQVAVDVLPTETQLPSRI